MKETEELEFIKKNLKKILACQCSESKRVEDKENRKPAIEICRNGQDINLNPLHKFIQTQIEGCKNNNNNVICDYVNNKTVLKHINSPYNAKGRELLKDKNNTLTNVQDTANNICNIKKENIVCDTYLKDLIHKLDYDQNESEEFGDRSIISINSDLIVIDQVDSSICEDDNLQQDINYSSVLKSNQKPEPITKQSNKNCDTTGDQSKNDGFPISGVNIILDFLKEDSSDPVDSSKNTEPVKKYLLPFVSEDKKENNDNEDPRWNYLKKLETDEERYKFVRECWKSLVVPDPNVNLTFHGLLRRRQRAKGILKDPGWPNNKNYFMEMSGKRKRSADDDDCMGNPKKKRKSNSLDVEFSKIHIEKAMSVVTQNYQEELNKKLPGSLAEEKLVKTYKEKIKALLGARHEIMMLHKFYSGLPDQNMSISQQDLENEQWDIEYLYERFKSHYKWDGKQFFP